MDSSDTDFDVLIVGAGISGISMAAHLEAQCPDKRYAILERRERLGGTWDLFRYPGVRSDSDMHTLGFVFEPWRHEKSIADGSSILEYLNRIVDERGIRENIRFGLKVESADFDSSTARWIVTVLTAEGERKRLTANWLYLGSGYYDYDEPYDPGFELGEFEGEVVHPQFWPEDLPYEGKHVVVIGSGATAMTLVPALAAKVAHITMLQRSPTYVVSRPSRDAFANRLRRLLPARVAYAITRKKNVLRQGLVYRKTRTQPEKIKNLLIGGVRAGLGPDYDVDTHFTPTYNPWDQRLCLIPDGDLFVAIRSGRASVVTDHIDTFTEDGILLVSGEELEADVIVTATGLNLVTLGEMDFVVDGEHIDFARTWTYRGLAYSDVPNLVSSFGYVNASWTLKADLTSEYVCRLLKHMGRAGATRCVPRLRPSDTDMPERPWIDDFPAGYMKRSMHLLPRQGDRTPWLNTQDYARDVKLIRRAAIDDGVMAFDAPDREFVPTR